MKYAHFIKISVFSYRDDGLEKIEQTLSKICPFNLEHIMKKKLAHGIQDREIQTYEIDIEKNNQINKFLQNLASHLNRDQKKLLIKQKESRLDDDNHFFIRFDKDKLFDGKYSITDSGNCFHIRISIASFPKKRETALKIIDDLFSL